MKMSLSVMTWSKVRPPKTDQLCEQSVTHVLVLQVLEQLELSVCALRQNRCAERLHDLLDGNILVGELIAGGAAPHNVSIWPCT